MTNKMRARIGAVLVGLATAVGFTSASAAGASHRDDRPGSYLALGDSVTFGYSPLLEDPWIPERFVGYPELIEQRTGMPTTNLGCPGQTASALVSRTALDNGCFDFRDFAREEGITVLHRINQVVERAARDGDATFVDVAGPFEQYAQRHGGDLCRAGLLIALPDGSCDLHPTSVGQDIIADAVLGAAFGHHHHHHHCSNHGDHGWPDHESRRAWRRHGRHAR